MFNNRLKIFSDQRYLADNGKTEVMLFPFWGKNPENVNDPDTGRFDAYVKAGRDYFTMTSLEDCDLVVLPSPWQKNYHQAYDLAQAAQRADKPLIIFFNSDSTEEIPILNSVIFRTSFCGSTRKSNEYALAAWSPDFLEQYFGGNLLIRQKKENPRIGYCGYYDNSFRFKIRNILGMEAEGVRIRSRVVDIFQKNKLVETNFLLRKHFWAGTIASDLEARKRVRWEFVRNLAESDYVLCARGGGNFSYRLYETLSMGRIPVLIDTDCVLPYNNYIAWKEFCVWVDARELDKIAEKVIKFHNSLSAQEFIERQKNCRKIWEEWISPQGFFKNFYRHFQL